MQSVTLFSFSAYGSLQLVFIMNYIVDLVLSFQVLHLSEVLLFCPCLGWERFWAVLSWRGAI